MWNCAPVSVVALEDDFFVGLRADEFEGPGSDRLARDFIERTIGHNPNRSLGEIPQQGGPRLFQMKDNRQLIGRFDPVDERAVGRGLRAPNLALEQGIERPPYIARCKRPPIVKLYARMQVEDI